MQSVSQCFNLHVVLLVRCHADGKLTENEIKNGIQQLIGKNKTMNEVKEVVALYDNNNDGSIKFVELVKWLTGRDMKAEFDRIDKNKGTRSWMT